MNYFKQIAEMFGVELNEEFILVHTDGDRYNECTYMFTELGLLHSCSTGFDKSYLLDSVIRGVLIVKKLPWKPKMGMPYWYYSEGWKEGTINQWQDDLFDLLMWKAGNCFKTKEDAEEKGKVALEQLRKEFRES